MTNASYGRPVVWAGPAQAGFSSSALTIRPSVDVVGMAVPKRGVGHYVYELLPLLLPITDILTQPRNYHLLIHWTTKAALAGFTSAGLALQLTPPPPRTTPFQPTDTVYTRTPPHVRLTDQKINYEILPQIPAVLDPTQRNLAPTKPWVRRFVQNDAIFSALLFDQPIVVAQNPIIQKVEAVVRLGKVAQIPSYANLLPLVPPPPFVPPIVPTDTAPVQRAAGRFFQADPFYSAVLFDQPVVSGTPFIQKNEAAERLGKVAQFPGATNLLPLYGAPAPSGTPFFGAAQDSFRRPQPYLVTGITFRLPSAPAFAYLLLASL